MITSILKKLFTLLPLQLRNSYAEFELKKWNKNGKPVPPPHLVKQKVIKECQNNYHIDTLVETGTYMGEMVEALLPYFKTIYSIELDHALWQQAAKKFSKYPQITILQGDSGKVLKKVIPKLKKKSIFWLDGHYSGGVTARSKTDCPIFEELKTILKLKINHILFIDDARLFNGKGDYPTIKKLSKFILTKKPKSIIKVKDDIIRVTLK